MGINEGAHPIGIRFAEIAQTPTDRFVDEKFLLVQVILDDFSQQAGVRFFLETELMIDGDATQPNIVIHAPFQQGRLAFGVAPDNRSDNPVQAIDSIPPGFCLDVLLQFRLVFRAEEVLDSQEIIDARVLEFAFIPFETAIDKSEIDAFFFFCGCKNFFIGRFPRTGCDSQKRELVAHIGRHLGSALFIAQRQQRFKNAIIPHGVNLPFLGRCDS